MAKKGGVQQLQADISTDEEFSKFLDRSGLLVLDVYTEWCGPCLGMVGSLKKIKLELGGDNLQLAICKSDTITALERFRKKSEPTWLFASHRQAVNIMFGTNVPRLMKLIAEELKLEIDYVNKKEERKFYEITEMQPIELQRYNLVKAAEDAAKLAEKQAAENKRRQYLMFVTDEITRNMPDMGVTIFGPHIVRDMYKKLMEPADAQKISCKDRRILQITKEDLEILHFKCNNPMDDEIWEHMLGKDILTCLWKAADGDARPIEEILAKYVLDCVKPQPIIDDFGNVVPDKTNPPVLPSLEIKIAPIRDESLGVEEINESQMEQPDDDADLAALLGDISMPDIENLEEGEDEEEGEHDEEEKIISTEKVTPKEKSKDDVKTITIPAVWAPGNHRTMAAAIYIFYRWHTGTFLGPDPVAEPPHLAIAFEAYKRKEITEVIERFKEDILQYGYFTTDDVNTAELITNSTKFYDTKVPQISDRLVIKVSKKTSHALLTLASHGPSYISTNTVTGEKECKKFFPEDYITEGDASIVEAKSKKKKKKTEKIESTEPLPGATEDAEGVEDEAEGTNAVTDNPPEESEGNVLAEGEKEELDADLLEAAPSPDAGTEPPPSTEAPAPAPESTETPAPAPESTETPGPAPESTEPPPPPAPEPNEPQEQKETPTQENKSVPGDEPQAEDAAAEPNEEATAAAEKEEAG